MCRAASVAAVLGAAVSLSSLAGAEPATRPTTLPASAEATPSPAAVDELLRKLSDPDFRVRESASRALVAIGPAVRPQLREFLRGAAHPEARGRVRTILDQYDIRERQNATTAITLDVKKRRPEEVFLQIGRQGGLAVSPRAASLFSDREFAAESFDFRAVPFWVAVKEACHRWNLRPQYEGGDGLGTPRVALVVDLTGEMACRHVQAGAATVVLSNARRRASFDHAGQDDLDLTLTFFMDPRWRMLEYPARATLAQIATAEGKTVAENGRLAIQPYREGSSIWAMRGQIANFPADARGIRRLAGECTLKVLEVTDPIELADPVGRSGVTLKARGGHSLNVMSVKRNGEQYVLRGTLFRNNLEETSWRRQRELDGIQLVDAAGRPLTRVGQNFEGEEPQLTFELIFTCDNPSERPATRLVWRMPLNEREVPVSFEFTDVTLGN
jgi:hypothetical protein